MSDERNPNLSAILQQANEAQWCARWECTTCGAHDLRDALLTAFGADRSLDQEEALHVLRELSEQPERLLGDPAIYILRWMAAIHPRELIATQLGRGAAGDLFERMTQAQSDAAFRRTTHQLRNLPEHVANLRAAKKLEKALKHAKRLQEKRARMGLEHPKPG